MLGQFGVPKSALEAFWEHLGGLGSILGAPRDNLGACWIPWTHLDSIWAQFLMHLGRLGSFLGAPWEHLGSTLGSFWYSFGCQNEVWMHLGTILEAPWSILTSFWEHFGTILDTSTFNQSVDAILDRFWIDF